MFQPSVFSEMTALAQQHGALNLAQGFPEFGPPEEAVEAYRAALSEGWHQYAPAAGLPALRQALSDLDRRRWGNDAPAVADPESEITVVPGATVGLYAAFLTLLQPGDQAVVLEPAYDSYGPAVRRAGGTVVTGSFAAPDWSALLSPRTRVVVVNGDMANAFTLPGGTILILNGMLRLTSSSDELAGIVAHEMGHIQHRDALAATSRAVGWRKRRRSG